MATGATKQSPQGMQGMLFEYCLSLSSQETLKHGFPFFSSIQGLPISPAMTVITQGPGYLVLLLLLLLSSSSSSSSSSTTTRVQTPCEVMLADSYFILTMCRHCCEHFTYLINSPNNCKINPCAIINHNL